MLNYAHIVDIDENSGQLVIYRQYEDGRLEFYTRAELPDRTSIAAEPKFNEFARLVGEAILIDSPAARRLLGI